MTPDQFYRAFEDRYRGSPELIASRLAVYLPFVRALSRAMPGAMLTDLGCGRGEWLALLRSADVPAQGVDLDEGMLQACRERGLAVERGDSIEYLKRLPEASQAAVTGFHFAEHIPFDSLHAIAQEALRVLRPGGLLILETPNPESLIVSTTDFRLDPSHNHPIPPKLLAFLAEFHGFEDVKILRLQERRDIRPGVLSVWDVLTGTSPDYALLARKAGAPLPEDAAGAWQQEYGVTLQSLALEYDETMRVTVAGLRNEIDDTRDAADGAGLAIVGLRQRLEEEVALLKNQHAATQQQLAALDSHLRDMLHSRSWRITALLRWAGALARRWRGQQGSDAAAPAAQVPRTEIEKAPDPGLSERGRQILREIAPDNKDA